MDQVFTGTIDFIYRVPALFGLGSHWPLEEEQSKAFGTAFANWIKSIPRKQRNAVIKAFSKWAPFLQVCFLSSVFTIPRIQETAKLLEIKKRYKLESINTAEQAVQQAQAKAGQAAGGNGAQPETRPASEETIRTTKDLLYDIGLGG